MKEEVQRVISPWSVLVQSKSLREALIKLDEPVQRAIYLRFWQLLTIEEIAVEMGLSWDEADKLISKSLIVMRGMLKAPTQKNKADDAA